MSLSLLDQPVDIQVEILRKLPIESVLQLCQTSREFRELPNKLDDYFRELTGETFGLTNKLTNKLKVNWYLTFLTIYNDLTHTTNKILDNSKINGRYKEYINIEVIKRDIRMMLAEIFKYVSLNPQTEGKVDIEDLHINIDVLEKVYSTPKLDKLTYALFMFSGNHGLGDRVCIDEYGDYLCSICDIIQKFMIKYFDYGSYEDYQ